MKRMNLKITPYYFSHLLLFISKLKTYIVYNYLIFTEQLLPDFEEGAELYKKERKIINLFPFKK